MLLPRSRATRSARGKSPVRVLVTVAIDNCLTEVCKTFTRGFDSHPRLQNLANSRHSVSNLDRPGFILVIGKCQTEKFYGTFQPKEDSSPACADPECRRRTTTTKRHIPGSHFTELSHVAKFHRQHPTGN